MKKILLLAIACVALAIPASAQYYGRRPSPAGYQRGYSVPTPRDTYRSNPWERNDMYFGLRLGMNVANVRSDSPNLDGTGTQTGLNVGAVVGFQLTRRTPLYFETGLYYAQKGGKADNTNGKFTYALDYLEVPLLLKYVHHVDRDISIQPYLGGYLAGAVAGEIKDYNNREAFSSFDNGYFNRFDGGIKLGVGAQFQMPYLDLSYDIGLANVGQDNFEDTRTGAFTVNVGLNF